jgi:hypothetical protein
VNASLQTVAAVPDEIRRAIRANARASAVLALRQAEASVRISAALDERGITALFFKGTSLGQRAFGSIALKTCRDIDVFVPRTRAVEAIGVLEGMGYRFVMTRQLSDARLRSALVRHGKDMEMISETGLIVELHWQLTRVKGLLPEFDTGGRIQTISLGAIGRVATFGDIDLLRFLAVHGVLHNWSRLKWLADVSALYTQLSPDDRADVVAIAQSTEPALSQALTLCQMLFDTQVKEPLACPKALTQLALERIETPPLPLNRMDRYSRAFHNTFAWRKLYRNPLHGFAHLLPSSVSTLDVIMLPLPAKHDWIYRFMRFPLWLVRQFGRRASGPGRSLGRTLSGRSCDG